jgi:hypothetical protein
MSPKARRTRRSVSAVLTLSQAWQIGETMPGFDGSGSPRVRSMKAKSESRSSPENSLAQRKHMQGLDHGRSSAIRR